MSAERFYGLTDFKPLEKAIDFTIEELSINGYSVLENILEENILTNAREKLDAIYKVQENNFGKDNLIKINEHNLVRSPLVYDDFFLSIATNSYVLEVVENIIGDYFILHLQNGIINVPNEEHHQSSWHRDLPYQNFTSSKPLALGALYCIDDFTFESGGTYVLPFSHRVANIPSQHYIDKFSFQLIAKAGSVILFDSMIFHKAGYNSSNFIRRAINHVYTVPIIKQQINLQTALRNKFATDKILSKLLGYQSNIPESDVVWREKRLKK